MSKPLCTSCVANCGKTLNGDFIHCGEFQQPMMETECERYVKVENGIPPYCPQCGHAIMEDGYCAYCGWNKMSNSQSTSSVAFSEGAKRAEEEIGRWRKEGGTLLEPYPPYEIGTHEANDWIMGYRSVSEHD